MPTPDALFVGLPVSAVGWLGLPLPWPVDAPAGVQLWFQYWIDDPAGPAGFKGSNGLRLESQ